MLPDGSELTCPHAERCGGCPLLGTPYAQQLAFKQRKLEQALHGYPELAGVSVVSTRAAASVTGYRLRGKLVVAERRLGLYGQGGHEVVDIPSCRVLSPKVKAAVDSVRAALPLPLLALDVREVDEGSLVTFIAASDTPRAELRSAAEVLMRAEPSVQGVALSRRSRRTPQLLGDTPEPLLGLASAPHHFAAGTPHHEAVPGGFVQSHAAQTDALHAAIVGELGRALGGLTGKRVLELYAGAGALALRLAAEGVDVTVCDSFAANLSTVTRAAEAQGLHVNVRFGAAEEAFAEGTSFDAVVVDPPRRGLSPAVRHGIVELAPRALVYVACEPRTLARDLAHFARSGYRTETLTPWDMIPLSDSVEALAVLTPGPAPAPHVLYEDERWLALEKPAFLPTTPQGEHAVSLLDRLRELDGATASVPAHRLDIGTSGVVWFAKEPSAVAELAQALANGDKEYLLLARGIVRKKGRIERALSEGAARRNAATRYVREAVVGTHSLVRATLETGRRHQIRRHFASIGHPILGDERYGDPSTNRHFVERHGLDRPFLHCQRTTLELRGNRVVVESPLPFELGAVLTSLAATRPKPASEQGSGDGQEPAPDRE